MPPDHGAVSLCPEQQTFKTTDVGNVLSPQAVQLASRHARAAAFLHQSIPSHLVPTQRMQQIGVIDRVGRRQRLRRSVRRHKSLETPGTDQAPPIPRLVFRTKQRSWVRQIFARHQFVHERRTLSDIVQIEVQGEADLPEIERADHRPRFFVGGNDGRHQQRRQHRDDGDDREKFDQAECRMRPRERSRASLAVPL